MATNGNYRLSTATGEYQKDWETKKTYSSIGKLTLKEDGKHYIKLDDMIVNYLKPLMWSKFDGFVSMFIEQPRGWETSTQSEDLPFSKEQTSP